MRAIALLARFRSFNLTYQKSNLLDVLIIGAGASGCFTAIRLKEEDPSLKIAILERQRFALQKVKISGGGRCNVTHDSSDVSFLLQHYPRKHKQLKGQLKTFSPDAMRLWLKHHFVETHAEADGRVFPKSNTSQQIIDTFLDELKRHNTPIHYQSSVTKIHIHSDSGYFTVISGNDNTFHAKHLVLATGSHESGYELAKSLGLSVTPLVPSLFTFCVDDVTLHACAGLSIADAELTLKIPNASKSFEQRGAFLITHWGVSGPAVLKLSARAAIELHENRYHATLFVNALPQQTQEATRQALMDLQASDAKRLVKNSKPHEDIPWRYWEWLLETLGISPEKKWMNLSKKEMNRLVEGVHHHAFELSGKGVFKEEFVTAGGVDLPSVNLQTLEAKNQTGVYVVGELLNVDGMTGGFNFQHCWASANAVAIAISEKVSSA
jgi:predicted Rossmann fold flavoprotein